MYLRNYEVSSAVYTTPHVLNYTTADVIDKRISIPAQHALVRLSKNPVTSSDAVGILQEIKSGRLGGIYCVNWEKPAQRALKLGKNWWTIIPQGEDGILMLDPDNPKNGQPLIAFRRELDPNCGLLQGEKQFAASPARIDAAILKAWENYKIWKSNSIAVCTLFKAVPIDVSSSDSLELEVGSSGTPRQTISDSQIMNKAFQDSRRTIQQAANALANLLIGFAMETRGKPLTDFQKRVLISVGRWLKVSTAPASRSLTTSVVRQALTLMNRNLAIKTSGGQNPPLNRVNATFHAQSYGNVDRGVDCGTPFFTIDGPKCRRDVISHEFFHSLGVAHGGGSLSGPTIRSSITTSGQALNSADNLAQLVSEIVDGKTDSCNRAGD